jgi:hypothetical protein
MSFICLTEYYSLSLLTNQKYYSHIVNIQWDPFKNVNHFNTIYAENIFVETISLLSPYSKNSYVNHEKTAHELSPIYFRYLFL